MPVRLPESQDRPHGTKEGCSGMLEIATSPELPVLHYLSDGRVSQRAIVCREPESRTLLHSHTADAGELVIFLSLHLIE